MALPSTPRLRLPKLRRPQVFSIRNCGYALMRLEDLDDLIAGKAGTSFSLRTTTERDQVEDKLRESIFEE